MSTNSLAVWISFCQRKWETSFVFIQSCQSDDYNAHCWHTSAPPQTNICTYSHWYGVFYLLVANQLHIPIFIIVHLQLKSSLSNQYFATIFPLIYDNVYTDLDFQYSYHLSSGLTNGKLPLWPAATIPLSGKIKEHLCYKQDHQEAKSTE